MAVSSLSGAQQPETQWWKGNLHTHTLWSDGDEFPELVAQWYKDHGYHFLSLSDHNTLSVGQRWIDMPHPSAGRCEEVFGPGWVQTRTAEGKEQIRVKPLDEVRAMLEEPGRFLLIEGEEVTQSVHANVIGAHSVIDPVSPAEGLSQLDVLEGIMAKAQAYRELRGETVLTQLNHPNFGWAISPDVMVAMNGTSMFEVFNGHPAVNNPGDAQHPSTEQLWDIALTARLGLMGKPVLYATGTDDAHNYREFQMDRANPGRGWVMVRAPRLTPQSLMDAMDKGDFYVSTGVVLADVQSGGKALRVQIEPQEGVTYETQFIGTLKSELPECEAQGGAATVAAACGSSTLVGKVLKTVAGCEAVYELSGDEIYVRAKVISSKAAANPPTAQEKFEVAWTQPVVPAK